MGIKSIAKSAWNGAKTAWDKINDVLAISPGTPTGSETMLKHIQRGADELGRSLKAFPDTVQAEYVPNVWGHNQVERTNEPAKATDIVSQKQNEMHTAHQTPEKSKGQEMGR